MRRLKDKKKRSFIMEKEIKLGALQDIYIKLFQNWDTIKDEIHLDPKNLYNLIGLKKTILSEMEKMQEAVNAFIGTIDGVKLQDSGGFQIPPEKIPEVNQKLFEMNDQTIKVVYTPIEIDNITAKVPINLIEALFEFIEIK